MESEDGGCSSWAPGSRWPAFGVRKTRRNHAPTEGIQKMQVTWRIVGSLDAADPALSELDPYHQGSDESMSRTGKGWCGCAFRALCIV